MFSYLSDVNKSVRVDLGNAIQCNGPKIPRKVDRIDGPLSIEDHMYMINHSLNKNIIPIGDGVIVSDPQDAPTTNGIPS
jgi:hypothetical protein